MREAVNPRQREILEYLREQTRTRAYPPTVREIGQAVGLSSSSTVQNPLNALEQKGYIRRDPTKSRTVEVVGEESPAATASRSFSVPLVGRVAAGGPILAVENIEHHIILGPEIAGGDDAFALHVRGDSMIEAGIHHRDMVVVRPQRDAASGHIVVARLQDEQTREHQGTVQGFYR